MLVYAVFEAGERHLLFRAAPDFDVQGWANLLAGQLRLLGLVRLIYEVL